MISKLALGTVQFGMDYGVNNSRGKVPPVEVGVILRQAHQAGITTLDTSSAYGQSEQVIGESLAEAKLSFEIVSKFAEKSAAVRPAFENTLRQLRVKSLYGYLVHHFDDFRQNRGLWDGFMALKREGKVKKIGFSLYHPSELETLFSDGISFDLLQIPYSVFDRRFEGQFSALTERGVEIHVRSVFLQGLVFKQGNELEAYFNVLREKLSALHRLSKETGVSVACLCLGFALSNKYIAKAVVGIDGKDHLDEMVANVRNVVRVSPVMKQLSLLREENEDVLLPTRWKKQGV